MQLLSLEVAAPVPFGRRRLLHFFRREIGESEVAIMDTDTDTTHYEINRPVPFTLKVSNDLLDLTEKKLDLARYPLELVDVAEDDWSQGAKVKEVQRLAHYWRHGFDWKAQEAAINKSFRQFKVKVDVGTGHGAIVIHFAHHRSSDADAIPILFVAGWPGSFLEARKLIQPMSSPESANQPSFHFVVASIPGFGPGDPPTRTAFGPTTTAKAFKQVMVDVLGYQHFVTQGGDVGASITRLMALKYPEHVRAYHLNAMPVRPPLWYKNPWAVGRFLLRSYLYSAKEQEDIAYMMHWQQEESAYSNLQRTKPQSLGFGLGDSPIGLLAWFLEKYHGWMDIDHYKISDDEILTFVMMHWMQGGTPGLRFYKASAQEPKILEAAGEKYTRANAWTTYLGTPLGYSIFPKELARPPLDWATGVANIAFYREHQKGGHFASTEQPELLVKDLRDWFGSETVKAAMKEAK